MITVKKISIHSLPELIKTSYEGDKDILESQHIAKFTEVEPAAASTFGMIKDMAAEKKLNCYKVVYQKKPIGYFVTFDKFLFSFGINIKFRQKEILTKWWREVVQSLEKNFLCILYPHQQKAIQFLRKNGMVILEVDKENNSVILIHK